MSNALRTWLAIFLAAGAGLPFGVVFLGRVVSGQPVPGYVDRVTVAERRYDPVRAELPAAGTVGYVLKARSPERLDWAREFGLAFARYTLAPLRVQPGEQYELVIEEHDEEIRVVKGDRR
jgi:hypothetical protein